MKLKSRFNRLYSESGLFLFLIRLPSKALKFALDTSLTKFYKLLLKDVGHGFFIEWGARIEAPRRVTIGNNVRIGKGTKILSEGNLGSLNLANNVEIGRDCRIDISGNITIHDNVLFSRGCKILTHSHGYDPRSEPEGKDLSIEHSVWLGSEVCVMESCNFIASSSIIASRALVSKSILEENSIYAGMPAKIIRKNVV